MAFTLEQEMIVILQGCTKTSQLKTNKHLQLEQDGFCTMETFRAKSWAIRLRNEETSEKKRTYLIGMTDILERNYQAMVERATTEKNQYNPESPKTKNMIVEEINLQITHFNTLNTILEHYKDLVVKTISLTADGGESLKSINTCETILKGAISGWIAQMQGHELHTKGVFGIIFKDSEIRCAGEIFSDHVRKLITEGEALKIDNKVNPFSNDNKTAAIIFGKEVTGLYERAALNGDKPKGPTSTPVLFVGPKPTKTPPFPPMSPASSSSSMMLSSSYGSSASLSPQMSAQSLPYHQVPSSIPEENLPPPYYVEPVREKPSHN